MEDKASEQKQSPKTAKAVKNRAPNDKKQPKKSIKTTLIIFGVLLFLIAGIFMYVKNFMPEVILQSGVKAMEVGNYKKALGLFDTAANLLPLDERPVNYQVEALSKLPPTYENQKALYEISQYDDFDAATERAEQVLNKIRQQLNNEIGSNYTDNILYDEQLIRWNNSEPITYSVSYDGSIPEDYVNAVKEAFQSWQNASNGEVSFKETPGNPNANISVTFSNSLRSDSPSFDPMQSGNAMPLIRDNVLNKVDIYIKPSDLTGLKIRRNEVYNIAQHQIGHALGLWGHSADSSDVMHYTGDYSGNNEQKMITVRDMNTLRALYKMEPDVIDKPLEKEQKANLYYHHVLTSYPGENFEKEIERIVGLLRQDSANIAAWVDLAINYGFLKDYARSVYILKSVLPLVSTDLQNQYVVLYNLAANYYKMKDYYTSRRYLNFATQLGNDFDTQLLDAFLDVKDYNATKDNHKLTMAEKKLLAMQKSYPDNIEVALKLVDVYFKKGDKKAEQETIYKLLKNNPKAINDRRVARYQVQTKSKSVF